MLPCTRQRHSLWNALSPPSPALGTYPIPQNRSPDFSQHSLQPLRLTVSGYLCTHQVQSNLQRYSTSCRLHGRPFRPTAPTMTCIYYFRSFQLRIIYTTADRDHDWVTSDPADRTHVYLRPVVPGTTTPTSRWGRPLRLRDSHYLSSDHDVHLLSSSSSSSPSTCRWAEGQVPRHDILRNGTMSFIITFPSGGRSSSPRHDILRNGTMSFIIIFPSINMVDPRELRRQLHRQQSNGNYTGGYNGNFNSLNE